MARPTTHHEKRVTTAVRLAESLHARLHEAAAERDVSVNLLVSRAITEYLDRLLPVEAVLAVQRQDEGAA